MTGGAARVRLWNTWDGCEEAETTLRFDSACPTDLARCAECLWVLGHPSGGLAGGAQPPGFISGVRPRFQ